VHDAVLRAAGNPLLTELSRDLLGRTTLGFPLEPYRREVFSRAVEEHTELVGAVVAGDVERAGRVARAHFGMSAEALRAVLARGLGAGGPGAGGEEHGSAPGPGTVRR
jgi:DNA-binding GntR family transcriptional regulator